VVRVSPLAVGDKSGQPVLRRSCEQGQQHGLRADLLAPGPRAYAVPHQQREQAGSATTAAENARCASIWLKFHASTSPCVGGSRLKDMSEPEQKPLGI